MANIQLGFFGKVPAHGDFVRRRVSGDFLAAWDPWLRAVVDATRRALGDDWLDIYLTSPVWRFAATPGVCGERACAGVVMPSVDAVGRYFPLTLVAELPAATDPFGVVSELAPWFDRAEALALSALDEQPAFELEAFDLQAVALGAELAASCPRSQPLACPMLAALVAGGVHYDVPTLDALPRLLPLLLGTSVAQQAGPYSLWWTSGSQRVAPGWLATPALPPAQRFVAALDGQWQQHGWHSDALQTRGPDDDTLRPLPQFQAPSAPPLFVSAGVSDVGKARTTNEDSMLEMADRGIWAVADGVGGQDAGDVASRMLTDALRQVHGGDLQARIDDARCRIEDVDRHLRHLAARPVDAMASASTIVVLAAGADGGAFVWAGDSRIYRLRDGRLEQCTKDHSLVQSMVDDGRLSAADARAHAKRNVITRAVGGGAELCLDVAYADVQFGDRYLLCSDGVHGSLDDAEIADVLRQGSCDTASVALVNLVLARGAPDNTTAVVVDAFAPEQSALSVEGSP